mgnify:CR=1 FL=1
MLCYNDEKKYKEGGLVRLIFINLLIFIIIGFGVFLGLSETQSLENVISPYIEEYGIYDDADINEERLNNKILYSVDYHWDKEGFSIRIISYDKKSWKIVRFY